MDRDHNAEATPASDTRGRVARPGTRTGSPSRRRGKNQQPVAFGSGTVSALRGLDPRGARFELEIDGITGVVSAEIIGEFRLAVGRVIDARSASALSDAVRRLAVFDHAVAILSRRPRSARDLVLRLRRGGATDADAAAALQRLQDLGLQDDAAFARHMAETRASAGRVSKRRLQQELRRKGVAADVSTNAVSEALGDVGLDEHEAAMAAAHKRMRALRSLDPAVARRRLYAFLTRRGYDATLIARVVRTALEAPNDE